MDPENTEFIARFQADNWWYAARRHLLERLLAEHGPFDRGLDLGCGVGANLATLERHCRSLVAIDSSPEAVSWCRSISHVSVRQGDATALGFPDGTFDLVTCLDVLEHLDDRRAVAEIHRVLVEGGLAVLAVPAHDYLWNENDVYSRHQRRYRRRDLDSLLEDFSIVEVGYWNFTTYLPVWAYTRWRRWFPSPPRNNLEAVPKFANRPLRFALELENYWRRWFRPPTGTSILALARRRSAHGGSA